MKRSFGWRALGLFLSISTLVGMGCADAESQETETVSGLTLIPPNRTVERGESFQLAVMRIQDGESDNVTEGTAWTFSDPTIAKVNSKGELTATRPGISRITAAADGLSATTSVYVLGRPVDIQLSPTIVRLAPNTTTNLSTTVISEDNTKRALSGEESWASSTPSIAKASGSTVQAVAPGTSTVTLHSRQQTFSRQVHVLDVTLDSLEPRTSLGSPIVVGQSVSLLANGRFTGRAESTVHQQDVSKYVKFEVADPQAGIVTLSGDSIKGMKPGQAIINVIGLENTVARGKSAQLTVQVLEVPSSIALVGPTKVSLQGEPTTVRVNGTIGSVTVNVSSMVTLNAEPAGIVNISGTTLTPLKPGEVKLTAQLGSGASAKQSTLALTVVDAPFASMAISSSGGNSGTVAVNGELNLAAVATFQSDVSQTVTRQVLWLSDKPTVAFVDNSGGASGTVTGLSAGTANIAAYYRGQLVGSKQITVTP